MTVSQTTKRNENDPDADVRGSSTFSAEERAAMQDRVAELKAASRRDSSKGKADGEQDLLAKIGAMEEPDRSMAERLHGLISGIAPDLTPQTWYGMPAYAKDGKVLFFFKPGQKFKARYATLGFTDRARFDDGDMWPTEFALLRWSPEVEAQVAGLVRRALA